jgi:hypothetical protein
MNEPMSKYSTLKVSRLGSWVGLKGNFMRYKIYTELAMKKIFMTVLYNDTHDQNKSTVNPCIVDRRYPGNALRRPLCTDIVI